MEYHGIIKVGPMAYAVCILPVATCHGSYLSHGAKASTGACGASPSKNQLVLACFGLFSPVFTHFYGYVYMC